jgi:hypothetical protein
VPAPQVSGTAPPFSGPAQPDDILGSGLPPGSAADDLTDTMAAFRPPDHLIAPEQTSAQSSGGPAGSAVEHDPFGDLFEHSSGTDARPPDLIGAAAADYRPWSAEPPYSPPGQPPGRRRNIVIAVLAAVVVLGAGGGAAFWVTHRSQAKLSAQQGQATPTVPGSHGTTGSSTQPLQSSTPSLTPTPTPSLTATATPTISGGLVSLAPGVSQDPDAARVDAFLLNYFAAINNHNFGNYLRLLDQTMQEQESAQSFRSGYRTTTDSAATLTAISQLSSGSVSAAVNFTSHQLPVDSPTHTACTNWSIVLYLHQQGSRYVIGPAPAGYQAVYSRC